MTEIELYPMIFKPQLKDYIWGGRNLEKRYNRSLPPGIIAESWEISGHPTAPGEVENGPLAGQTLPQVLQKFGAQLIGHNGQWALDRQKFPLLIKLLDANQNLSVQVHPKDDYAQTHEAGSLGKTEMWYILHAAPDAKIIFGLKAGVTREKFRVAIANNTLADYLHALPVKTGDAIFVEAGSIHALLGGTVVAEIQQNSDITYRVYDWGRVGHDGQPRALHVDKAIDVTNFNQIEPGPYQPHLIANQAGITRFEISRCSYFVVEKVGLEPNVTYHGHTDGSTMEIWGTIEGCSTLSGSNGPEIDLPTIRFCLVPAGQGDFKITATTACTMLRTYLPN